MQYVYPAIFVAEQVAGRGAVYTVSFPDIPGCVTEGDSVAAAMEMAREALAGCILSMQVRGETLPEPSALDDIAHEGDFTSLIDLDMLEYRRKTDSRAVKRTVSLPRWLDALAQDAGLNFSQTFQDALKERLGVRR